MDPSTQSGASSARCTATPAPDSGSTVGAVQSRLDPPHQPDESPPTSLPAPATGERVGSAAESDGELLHRQAAELAEHLRRWDADLARRERGLHDGLRALDQERREFRLWMQQMQCRLEAQREALERMQNSTAGDPFESPA